MLKYLLTGEMTRQEIRIKLSVPCRPVWTMDPAGPVLLIEVGEESPEEGHGANLICTKLASFFRECGLTFFGAQSNIGLLRFSRMWKLGFLGGSSSLSGVGGLLVNGTEC